MSLVKSLLPAGVFVLSLALQGQPPTPRRFDLSDLAQLTRVTDPQISPDGKSIVIVVSRPNYELDLNEAELTLVDTVSGATRVLTHDRKGVSFPRWSPAGDRLAFLANDAGNKPQIFVLPMTGGDARCITQAPGGVQQFAWNPAGDELAFATADEASKRTGSTKFDDAFEVGDNDFLLTAQPLPTHLWLVAAAGGASKRLTAGTWSLPTSHPPSPPASPIAWAPDGKTIAFVKLPNPYSGDAGNSTLHLLDVASGKYEPITGRQKNEGYPAFSPDGKRIAYWYPKDGQNRYGNETYIVDGTRGEGRVLTTSLDRNIARSLWMPDSQSLLVGANDGTTVGLWIQPLTGPAARLPLGRITPASAFWVDAAVGPHGEIAFSGSEPSHPSELYFIADPHAAPQRLTHFNDVFDSLAMAHSETMHWNCEGFTEDGVLTYPPDFSTDKKYPLVLYIHGGPRSASKDTFSIWAQMLAAKGWLVFEPNYRGSDNLGNKYQGAIWSDAGDGPGRDVMAGLAALEKKGFVDASKIAVSGWSYGGFMTTWLLGHYPTVWKAAIAGAAVTNFLDQYDLGDANVRRGESFGGSPYTNDRLQSYLEQSPITYAAKIKTPTLILSDTGDYRVPITQSYSLFHVLKDNGIRTQFFAYPVAGHSPADPVRMRDIYRRWISWLTPYLQ